MSADEEATEPVRLHDDPNEPLSLRDELVREKALRVDYDVASGLARFNATLAAAGPSTALGRAPARAPGRWTTKAPAVVGLAILVAGAGVSWLGRDDRAVSPAIAPPTSQSQTSEKPQTPRTAESFALPTFSVDSLPTAPPPPSPGAARTARPAVTTRTTVPPSSSARTGVDPLEETRHLGALRRVAASDPRKALSMVAEGNQRFAGGSFREERDAIAVDALARLGQDVEAKRAGATFLTTYPTSPLAPSVRRAAGL